MWNGQRLDSYKMPWAQRPSWAKDVPSPLLHMCRTCPWWRFSDLYPMNPCIQCGKNLRGLWKKQNVTQWCPVVHFNVIMTKLNKIDTCHSDISRSWGSKHIGVFCCLCIFLLCCPMWLQARTRTLGSPIRNGQGSGICLSGHAMWSK